MCLRRRTAWLMWLVAAVFYAYQYILRVIPSVMLEQIMLQFEMDAAVFGQFSGVYYIGYSIAHIPIGVMLDRYGPRKVVPLCILLSAAGVLPIIFAEQWVYPTVGRIITGIGSSAAILGLFKIIRMAFDEQYFTRMLGFSVTIGLIGAIYGGAPVRSMCEIFSYRNVIGVIALVGFFLAVAACAIMSNTDSNMEKNVDKSIFLDLKCVLSNHMVVIICISSGLMVGPLEGFADVWGPKFLTQIYGIGAQEASYLTSLIFIGMCFGASILSFIAEKIGHLKTVVLSGVTMFLVFLLLIVDALNMTYLTVVFVIVGVCSAYQILAIYKISTYVDKKISNIATALANMIIMTFGYILHGAIGGVINICDKLSVVPSFSYGISVIPTALVIGTMGIIIVHCMDNRIAHCSASSQDKCTALD